MFLAFDVKQVLISLPIDFKKLMIIGSFDFFSHSYCPYIFGKPFYIKLKPISRFLLGHVHVTTVTLFELGVLLAVVGVIVTVMLSISGGKS